MAPAKAAKEKIDHELLTKAQNALKTCKAQINTAIQLGMINDSSEVEDPAFQRIGKARRRLENAISGYESLEKTDSDCSPSNPSSPQSESKLEDPTSEKKRSTKLKSKIVSLFSSKKDSKSTKPAVDVWGFATDELKFAVKFIVAELVTFTDTTAMRSCVNEMGSFYTLLHCQKLVSVDNQSGAVLTGRYKDSGRTMYQFVTQMMRIEVELDAANTAGSGREAVDVMKKLYSKLGVACDVAIAFLLAVPFDLSGFESALEGLKSNGETLQSFVENKGSRKGLFDGKSIPHNLSSGNGSFKHEKMMDEINGIVTYLEKRKSDYELEKKKFDIEMFPDKQQFQAIENLGLKEADLSDTEKVFQSMKKPRKQGGLGLPVICVGNDIAIPLQKQGGYGIVSRMNLPADAFGVDDIKNAGRFVAVKIVSDKEGSKYSLGVANLRMLREAFIWAAVQSDPRKLSNGGQHLAQVLGVWDDFQDRRPGLVSLWGECDLKVFLQTRTLDVRQKLQLAHKVARGVYYLHTCKPTIVHGDLKAANVIMVDGEPYLTDFGVGKCLDGVRGFTTGFNSYTDDYRAPEIQHREVSLVRYPTTESDVYAFGCVLFEILSGKAPFDGFSETARRKWTDSNLDRTPLDAESTKPDSFSFEEKHTELMDLCFKFHASERPSMGMVVDRLEDLIKSA